MQNTKTLLKLVECAVMIALSTVLSYITIFKAPMGGSITAFSQVPIIVIGYRHGIKWGAFSGIVHGLLQMFLQGLGNFAYVKGIVSYIILILFDYVIAFAVLGIGGAVLRKAIKQQTVAIGLGAVIASALRLLCHFISGVTIWGEYADGWKSVWIYSLSYNGFYMLFECIISVIGVVALATSLDLQSPNLVRRSRTSAKRNPIRIIAGCISFVSIFVLLLCPVISINSLGSVNFISLVSQEADDTFKYIISFSISAVLALTAFISSAISLPSKTISILLNVCSLVPVAYVIIEMITGNIAQFIGIGVYLFIILIVISVLLIAFSDSLYKKSTDK